MSVPISLAEIWQQMILDVGGSLPGDDTLVTLMLAFANAVQNDTISYIPGIVTGGAVDNLAAINAWIASLPSYGGIGRLPAGRIGLSAELDLPEGIWLIGDGWPEQDLTHGTWIVPLSTSTATSVVKLTSTGSGLSSLGVNATPATGVTNAVTIAGTDNTLDKVTCHASSPQVALNGLSGADNANLSDVYCISTGNPLNWDSPDTNAVNVRTLSGTSILAGNGVWSSCHFTNVNGLNLKFTGGSHYFSSCFIDSAGATALIQHTSTAQTVEFSNCRFFQNAGISGLPVVNEQSTTTGVKINGCHVPSNGAGNQFASIIDAPNAYDAVELLTMDSGAVAATGSLATMWGSGLPGYAAGNTYAGVQQPQVGTSVRQLYKQSLTAVAIAGGTSGSPVTIGTVTPDKPNAGIVPAFPTFTVASYDNGTITVTFTATFSDSTTGGSPVTASANGTVSLTAAQINAMLKDGVWITQIKVTAYSTNSSTAATVAATVGGLNVS